MMLDLLLLNCNIKHQVKRKEDEETESTAGGIEESRSGRFQPPEERTVQYSAVLTRNLRGVVVLVVLFTQLRSL